MSGFNVGDEVITRKWGIHPRTGEFWQGKVRRVFPNGDVTVHWDGALSEDRMSPDEVELAP